MGLGWDVAGCGWGGMRWGGVAWEGMAWDLGRAYMAHGAWL